MEQCYLDNAATTKVHPKVIAAMTAALDQYANPSSLHEPGAAAEQMIVGAREEVARLLAVKPDNLIFTSGGTEANNLAIMGFLAHSPQRGRLVTTAVEHPSVREVFAELANKGRDVVYLPVDRGGQVELAALAAALTEPVQLVSIMTVNNEIGTIQPLAEAVRLIRATQPRTCIHTDAVQALAKVDFAPAELGVNLVSVSAHKIHGPKGIGALYVDKQEMLSPLFRGGGQEGGLRSGTENVPGIVGFGCAARELRLNLAENIGALTRLRRQLISGLAALPCRVISPAAGAPHIVAAVFPGYKGEILVHALSARGVYVATGAACSGKRGKAGYVARAIGLESEWETMLRFSLSPFGSEAEIEYALNSLAAVLAELAFTRGRRGR